MYQLWQWLPLEFYGWKSNKHIAKGYSMNGKPQILSIGNVEKKLSASYTCFKTIILSTRIVESIGMSTQTMKWSKLCPISTCSLTCYKMQR